jgi:hypothetical protein
MRGPGVAGAKMPIGLAGRFEPQLAFKIALVLPSFCIFIDDGLFCFRADIIRVRVEPVRGSRDSIVLDPVDRSNEIGRRDVRRGEDARSEQQPLADNAFARL